MYRQKMNIQQSNQVSQQILNPGTQNSNVGKIINTFGNQDYRTSILNAGNIQPQTNKVEKNENIIKDIGDIGILGVLGAKEGLQEVPYYIENATEATYDNYKNYRTQQFQNSNKVNDIGKSKLNQQNANFIMKTQGGIAPIENQEVETNLVKKKFEEDLNKTEENINEVQSRISSSAASKIGEVIPSVAQSTVGGAFSALNPGAGLAYFSTSASGAYTKEGRARGMTDKEAVRYGTILGFLDGASEQFITGQQVSKIKKAFSGKELSKSFLDSYGMNILENTVQEAIMEPAQEVTALIVNKDKADFSNMASRMFEAGFNGALAGIITNGATAGLSKAGQAYDKIVSNKKITNAEFKEVLKESIEVFGEENVKNQIKNSANQIFQNVNEIAQQNNTQETTQSENIAPIQQITQQEQQIAQNGTSGQIQQNVQNMSNLMQTAVQYNKDTNDTSLKLVDDMLNRRGITGKFDGTLFNNENQNAIWRVVGINEDGTPQREVIFNPNSTSNKAFIEVAVHEMSHDLEGDAAYHKKLVNNLLKYAQNKEGYAEARKALEETYSKVYDSNSRVFQQLIDEEFAADMLAKNLGNQEFINQLVNQDRTTMQKVWDWIKQKINSLRGNTNEAVYWQDIANKFEKAYNQKYQGTNEIATKYHISENFSDEIDKTLNNTLSANTQVKARDFTPKILVNNGVKDLPMLITQKHIKSVVYTLEEAKKLGLSTKNINYHGLGKELLLKAIDNLDTPQAIYKTSNNNYFVVTEFKDNDNREIIVPIHIDGKGNYNDVYIDENQIKSVYGKNNLERYIKNNKFEQIYKKEDLDFNEGVQYSNIASSSTNIIPQSNENINQNEDSNQSSFSMQEDNKGRKLTKEQQEFFKDSKVVDEKGNLKTVYHGTERKFNTFNYDNLGKNTSSLGAGFYFTDQEKTAREYTRGTHNLKEVYLDIKKPMSYGKTTITKSEYQNFIEAINKETKGQYLEDYEGIENTLMEYEYGGDDIDLVNAVHEASGLTWEKVYKILKDTTGFDGIISDKGFINKGETIYVAFNSNQIKNVDNVNPTDSSDIRYSTDNKTFEQWLKDNIPSKGTKGKTIQELNIAPIRQDIANNNQQVYNNTESEVDTYARKNESKRESSTSSIKQNETEVERQRRSIQERKRAETEIKAELKNQYGFNDKITKKITSNLIDKDNIKNSNQSSFSLEKGKAKSKTNIIEQKVTNYIEQVRDNFITNVNINTKIISQTDTAPINYKHAKEVVIKNKAQKLFARIKRNVFKNGNENIYVDKSDIKESIHHTLKDNTQKSLLKENLAVYSKLDKIIENGKQISKENELKNRPQFKDWKYYVSNVNINGNPYVVEFDTTMKEGQRHFRIERLYKINEVDVATSSAKNSPPGLNATSTSINNIIPQSEKNNNIAEKTSNNSEIPIPIEDNRVPSQNNPIGDYTRTRKHYESVMRSPNTSEQARKVAKGLMRMDTYTPDSNEKQLKRADERITKNSYGADGELQSLLSKATTGGKIDATDVAVGERLIQYYSKTGEKNKLQDAIQATAMAGTSAGQTVQALSLLNHQTPEGQAIWIQRSVDKMNNELKRRRGDKAAQFDLTEDMIDKIVNSKDKTDLQKNVDEVYEQLGNQVSKTVWQKIDSWRYFAMLANVRTHLRNIAGNAAMGTTQIAKNKVAGAIEGIVSKVNPEMERTHTLKPASKEVKEFAKNDIPNIADTLGLNENKYNPKTRLENSMRTFKSETLENTIGRLFDLNDKALEAEDGWGLKAGYVRAMSEYMTANELTPENITDKQLSKARNYAINQAQEATFHQASKVASALNQISKHNAFTKFAADALVPFKKTPVNIAKAGLEYSPVGLAKSMIVDTVRLRKGNITVNQYIDNISKGLTGSGIAFLGYVLADIGILKASGGDDDSKEKYDEQMGNQTYSITIGDNTYSLDWLAPSGIPLFIGAEIFQIAKSKTQTKTSSTDEDTKYSQISESGSNILNAFASAMSPMAEMSMLSGLTSTLQSYEQGSSHVLTSIGIGMGKSYVNQFVPTLFGQLAKTLDTYERSTTSTKTEPLSKAIDQTKNQIMNKIPGLRQMLPIKTDIWGNEMKQSDSIVQRTFENGIAPWTRKSLSSSKVDNELNDLYDSIGESSIFPKYIDKNLTINGQNYRLTSDEYNKYQKEYGQTSYKLLDNLMQSKEYSKLTYLQKQKAIEEVYNYAKEKNKVDYAKKVKQEVETSTTYKVLEQLKDKGLNQTNYLNYLANTSEVEEDTEKLKILTNSNYSNDTKDIIYRNTIGKNNTTYPIVSNANINFDNYANATMKIAEIKDKYANTEDMTSKQKTAQSKTRKAAVKEYINSLDLTINQKLILQKTLGGYSIKDYKDRITNYVNSLNINTTDKTEMLKKLFS